MNFHLQAIFNQPRIQISFHYFFLMKTVSSFCELSAEHMFWLRNMYALLTKVQYYKEITTDFEGT